MLFTLNFDEDIHIYTSMTWMHRYQSSDFQKKNPYILQQCCIIMDYISIKKEGHLF